MSNVNFRKFIQSMLERAGVNKEYRELFTDPQGMKMWNSVVTHSTHDPMNNYEDYEFMGDGIIKGILSQYIIRRFPNIRSQVVSKKGTTEGVLSKTRRSLEQRKTLSDFALKLGFWDYVKADEETLTKKRKETLEDVFEAFVGALVEIVDARVKEGLGYHFAYKFVKRSLDEIEIDISAEALDDPITRLNELYKANILDGDKKPLKWGDAIYVTAKMLLPRVDELPDEPQELGTVIFVEPSKTAFIYTKDGWKHTTHLPAVGLRSDPLPDPEGLKINQLMWYAGVYGFPNAPEIPVGAAGAIVTKETKPLIEANPENYGAEIIGQGLHFLLKEAKKMAATQALHYLNSRGIRKATGPAKE